MLRRATVALLVGGLLGTGVPARGDDVLAQAEAPDGDEPAKGGATRTAAESPPSPNREGEYSGVDPDKPSSKPSSEPAGKKGRKVAPGTLTWIGFSAENGGAELFFQAPSRFAASQRLEGKTLVVELDGLTRMARNTRRPLDTRFFDTPVARVTARAVRARRGNKKRPARKAGVEVRIAFKNAADAREGSLRTGAEADGAFTIYLDLPASGGKAAGGDE